jgi:hypothetical protein
MTLILIIFKYLSPPQKKMEINWLILFKEIITVYSVNRMRSINTFCGQNTEGFSVKVHSAYSYRWDLNS